MIKPKQQFVCADEKIKELLAATQAKSLEEVRHILELLICRTGVWIAHNTNHDVAMQANYKSYIHHYNKLAAPKGVGQQEVLN